VPTLKIAVSALFRVVLSSLEVTLRATARKLPKNQFNRWIEGLEEAFEQLSFLLFVGCLTHDPEPLGSHPRRFSSLDVFFFSAMPRVLRAPQDQAGGIRLKDVETIVGTRRNLC
jgi:hypothetical protein